MKQYLLIYRAVPGSSMPEEEMQDWAGWFAHLKKEDILVDMGKPVQSEGKIILSEKEVADKPIQSEDGARVIAYSIIKADNIDKAVKIVQAGPAIKYGCTVELREVIPM